MIAETLWLFLPAGLANMSPRLFSRVNFLNFPISERWFGAHKTYRGFFFGTLVAIVFTFVQKLIFDMTGFGYYGNVNILLLGLLLGFGALFGDLIKSFFKRKIGIGPGNPWIPFDQMDFVVGGLIFVNFYIALNLTQNFLIFFVYLILHPLINYLGYLLKVQKNKL